MSTNSISKNGVLHRKVCLAFTPLLLYSLLLTAVMVGLNNSSHSMNDAHIPKSDQDNNNSYENGEDPKANQDFALDTHAVVDRCTTV